MHRFSKTALGACGGLYLARSQIFGRCENSSDSMIPSGVGMRRKKILFVDLDIYLINFSMASSLVKVAKNCLDKEDGAELLANEVLASRQKIKEEKAVAISLKFVRSVTTSQVVEAFNDAFIGVNQKSVDHFKTSLANSIGMKGTAAGEEIVFIWRSKGGVLIQTNGEIKQEINDEEVERRLLEVYIDPKRTVSPDLIRGVRDTIRSMNA